MFQHRLAHYGLLLVVTALLTLPNLGSHSLWDIDEGVNAEAAREMLESGNWITPTFNYELRTAKPALLYWLQSTSYMIFGVQEWSARFPSVLAAMGTILLVYELGRRMFSWGTGLLAGLILASCIEFALLSHAATPDSTLLFFTTLTYFCFWTGSVNGRRTWFFTTPIACGLATLTKGPVGVALPALVILLYFAWNRQLHRLRDRRLLWGILIFLLVALPWYILVTHETRGAWAKAFFGRENLSRFMQPMENHSGPIFYHALTLLVLYAPWSIFLLASLWYGYREVPREDQNPEAGTRTRFLFCWFSSYLVFFSLAATKLPNYVLPLYPALALLTAHFLERWRLRELVPAKWLLPAGILGLGFVGLCTFLGLLIAGGAVPLPFGKMRLFPGLENWAAIGLVPLLGSLLCWYWYRRDSSSGSRTKLVQTLTVVSILYVGLIAAFPVLTMDRYKAPRRLVEVAEACQPEEDVKLGSLFWFQPSMVFYSQREVRKLQDFAQTNDFLSLPQRVFLFVPDPEWQKIVAGITTPYRELCRHYDFLKNCDIVVVTNQ